MLRVTWVKNSQNNQWFDFLRLNLDAPYFAGKRGVYVIWYTTPAGGKAVRVGSGDIGARLKEHRANPEVTKYSSYGEMKVTWTTDPREDQLEGVEAFLARKFSPLVGERSTGKPEIEVNLF